MKNLFLLFTLLLSLNITAQTAISGILNHTNGYLTIHPYNSSYDDGSYVKAFYDGNKKLIHLWNSDATAVYTNLRLGNLSTMGKLGVGFADPIHALDIVGVLGFRGINASNLPSNHWRMYFNASSTVDNGLQFRVNDELRINFKYDTFMFDGLVKATEIKVQPNVWSDFVFAKDYDLPSLEALEAYIHKNKHLPEIPTEVEVIESGINLGEMNAKLLQKIEELTLYLIEEHKQNQLLKQRIEKLEGKAVGTHH